MEPVAFSPQSASVTDIEQSEAARAKDMDVRFGTPTISAKAATFDNRMADFLVSAKATLRRAAGAAHEPSSDR